MSNLTVENLAGSIQSGDLEKFLNGNGVSSPTAPNARATNAMREEGLSPTDATPGNSGASFGQILESSIDKVNEYQAQADRASKELISGRSKNIHETMLTLERADTSLKLMMQVRNKVLEAYKEIMKMQI